MSRYLDLAKKLKALADRGIGGEKINAERMLNDFLKKHNISLEEIEDETVNEYYFKFEKEFHFLWNQICGLVGKKIVKYGEFPKSLIKKYKLEGNYMCKCTASQYIEIESMFEFYKRVWIKELEIFEIAFFGKNDLLCEPEGDNKNVSREIIEKHKKAALLTFGMDKHTFRKQLSNPKIK